jgi:hypothetical protein
MVSNKLGRYIIAFFLVKIVILSTVFVFRDETLRLATKCSIYLIERKNNATITTETYVKDSVVFLKNLEYKDDTITTKIDEAKININFSKLLNLSLAFDLNFKNLDTKINQTNKGILFDANLSYERSIKTTKKLDLLVFNLIDPNILPKSKLHIIFDENRKIKLDIEDFPISIYRTITKLVPIETDELVSIKDFLNEYIDGGIIKSGKLETIVPKNISELSLEDFICNFEINDIDFIIPNNMPRIKGINTVVKIENDNIVFDILSGGFDKTYISGNSRVILKPKEEIVLLKVYTNGPTKDLTGFLEKHILDKLKKDGLDLRSISGKSEGESDIVIPLDYDKPNTYLVNFKLKDAKISAFGPKIEFESKILELLFDGDLIKISGSCMVNKNKGYLNYIYNINKSEIENDLGLDFYLSPQDIMNNISIKDNEIKLSLKYKNKLNHDGNLTIESDLTNSTINFEKLGITKKFGDPARLILHSDMKDQNPKFDIKLTSKNLDLSGYAIYSENTQVSHLKIKTKKDSIILDFKNNKNMLSIKFIGNIVDLTKVNFLEYLQKNNTHKNVDLDVNIKTILLNNNINADDLKFRMFCNSKKCTSASLSAGIGSRKINIDLDNTSEKEKWRLFTDNAGAFFKGIGLYTKVKAGILNLSLEVGKENKANGDIVTIKNGEFKLDKFVLVDNSLVMKMTSLVSLPGLINLITNNNDVKFSRMSGNFEFDGERFKLTQSIAEGPYFDFTMLGYVDINKRAVLLRGGVTPSVYGISFIVKKIPVVKMLFSSKKRNGIIYAPYALKFNY